MRNNNHIRLELLFTPEQNTALSARAKALGVSKALFIKWCIGGQIAAWDTLPDVQQRGKYRRKREAGD